jgi:thiol-disulfide isomerase/thioredoxin
MKEITSSEFEKEVLNGGKVVLDFYSSECPPCEALAPKFEALARLYGNDITFLKIFRQQNRDLADKLGVNRLPPCCSSMTERRFKTDLRVELSAEILSVI